MCEAESNGNAFLQLLRGLSQTVLTKFSPFLTTHPVLQPPEKKLAKRTSVQCTDEFELRFSELSGVEVNRF